MLSDNLKCLETKKPPPNWFIAQEVINRQIGSNPLFQRRFYSSLHAVNRLEFKYKLCDLEDTVSALSFNQKGNLLARASEKTVSIWDWAAKKKRCCFPNGHDILIEAKWLPLDVENFMVTSGYDGCIRLLDLEYNSSRQMINYDLLFHPTHIDRKNNWALAVHPEIPYIVFSAYNDSILSIDIRENTPKLLDIKNLRNSILRSIHCNPSNSNEFCVGGHFPCIRVYDQRNISNPLYQLWTTKYNRNRDAFATITIYNHDGTEILTLCNLSEILLFEKSMWSCEGNSNHTLYERSQFSSVPVVGGINFFGPKSEFIISGSYFGDIFIFDKKKKTALQWLTEDYKFVKCFRHPHIPILATASKSNVLIWMPSGNEDPTESTFKTVCIDKNYLCVFFAFSFSCLII
ncbi:DDB1- and CUL4-associated factor 8 [Cyphomyrmex costatus]|uniref:DDB1-and CUL4-associated factor 8 n=1 Tax=Cyphomyrmex costatus TaxID=456900 RepID=A0A151IDV9_9HYME|nr:DDB1- and CUL4-associated factor 8 [Cyphomyrmex costatus]